MQSYQEQEVSLHRLLQHSAATPDYVQLKPKGFKAILQSTVEFLEAQAVAAHLLVKLPKGDPWYADLRRYSQDLPAPYRVVQVVRSQRDPADSPVDMPTPVSLPLASPQIWRGDYFLLIFAEGFAAMVVAHRLRPLSATAAPRPNPGPPGPEEDDDEALPPLADGAIAARSSYLSVCCSVNPGLVATVAEAVWESIAPGATAALDLALEDVIHRWTTAAPAIPSPLVDRWLNWQIHRQEHLRQTASTYRRQALTLSVLSSQNEALMHTLRLKDDFLNTVGQELRTPLTTIKTALTLLDSAHLKPPQRQRYREMISHECDRQSALISGVLNLLQVETSLNQSQPEALNLKEAVPPVVSTYQPLAEEKGILLAYTIPPQLPPVSCPDSWLRQILIHLLNNSLKYTPSGGQVWVTVRGAGNLVEMVVRDTGTGIAAVDLPRIFDYFYRGRNLPAAETEGAGLGLSIVQQLLVYCGGSVAAHSQPGEGATLVVRLPVHRDPV